MRIIILLSVFLTLLISNTSNFIQSSPSTFIDKNSYFTLDTITTSNLFLNDNNTKSRVLDKPIWSYFTIKSNDINEQEVIIYNSLRILRYVDVLVIHEDGSKEKFFIGTNRKHNFNSIGTIGYPITLKPNESVEIYTKHDSIGLVNTTWMVNDIYDYYKNKSLENIIQGITLVLAILLIIHGFVGYYFTKEKSNLYFSGFMFSKVLVFLSFSGLFYVYSYELGLFFRNNFGLFSILIPLFESLFLIYLYNLKVKSKIFYKIFVSFFILSSVTLIISMYSISTIYWIYFAKFIIVYVLIFTLFTLTFALYAVYKKWVGSTALLIAIFLHIYVRFTYITSNNPEYLFSIIPMLVSIVELVFISIALTLKVREIYDEKIKSQKMILNHAKYLSIGKMHASTIHQLRTPISQIGAIAARIQSVFEQHKKIFNKEEYEASNELESIVKIADNTISDLYNLYSREQEKEYFDLKEAIQEIMILINSKSDTNDIEINMSLVSAPMFNYPNALKHIIIIILENASDILIERNIQGAKITISLLKDKNEYNLQICDNGGGIKVKPIEDIFEIYKSYKKTKGLGLGLALAKDLSKFTQTQLDVSNTNKGACFRLNIPI